MAEGGVGARDCWSRMREGHRTHCPRPCPPPCTIAAHSLFDGRTLDDNKIRACYVPEEEWARSEAGEWVTKQRWVGAGYAEGGE